MVMPYEVDVDKLKKHYDELIRLEDWIPEDIEMWLPAEVSLKLGSKVRNKDLWWDRIMRHKVFSETSKMSGPALLELEDERFMEKYPQFAYLFTKVEL